MGSVNAKNNKLYLDFRFRNQRCKEYTKLPDTPLNRNRLSRLMKKIEAEILLGSFDYGSYFPNSKLKAKFDDVDQNKSNSKAYHSAPDSPRFEDFANTWLSEMKIEWGFGHYEDVSGIVKNYLLPTFGRKKISAITKADILQFRTILAKVPGKKTQFLSPSRINHIMTPLRMMLNEAAERYDYRTPWRNIKALKVGRTEIAPFSIQEIDVFLALVPDDFKCYYTTRFFTGLRTGEIDGLMWKDVDLTAKTITVNQALIKGQVSGLKTESSHRTVFLIDRVVNLLRQHKLKQPSNSQFVFTNFKGKPLDYAIVSRTVWYPTLEKANLKKRNPYQTRHTFATLLLASGEAPEWIAQQMGHSTTTMLFRVYSRYVPNLTRQDGSAFAAFLTQGGSI